GQLIEEKFGRRYSESQVWRILIGLGFSSQRPTSRALERDEEAIRRWKRVRWPALKKTPENKAGSSSSSTNRDWASGQPRCALGAPGHNGRAAVSLQLAPALGDGRYHLLSLLLPALPGCDQGASGRGVPSRPGSAHPPQGIGDLGWAARASQSGGARLHRKPQGRDSAGVPARLCSQAQPDGVHLGTPEA